MQTSSILTPITEPQEEIETFSVKLRRQGAKCDFRLTDENIIEQITEKKLSDELRKKILKLADAKTLDDIIKEANVLDALVNHQLGHFSVYDTSDMVLGGKSIYL